MQRQAMTLLELLVVISIIGLVMALLMPAVQRARESGRRVQCSSNLRQLGIALNNYHSDYGVFPTALAIGGGGTNRAAGHHSPHVRLLPYLSLVTIYNAINLQNETDTHAFDRTPGNTTAYSHVVDTFLCPSESSSGRTMPGQNSYRFSTGAEATEVPSESGGLFAAGVWYSAPNALDGLSQTASISERHRGDFDASHYSRGDYWYAGGELVRPSPDEALHFCDAAVHNIHESTSGITWFHAGYHGTWYNHVAPPNHAGDCSMYTSIHPLNMRRGVFSASSFHLAGVHTLFADGHVQFIQERIGLPVWRALGTRQSSDDAGAGAF